MSAASRYGGQTTSPLPLRVFQHFLPVTMVWMTSLVPPVEVAGREYETSSVDETRTCWANCREEDMAGGARVCFPGAAGNKCRKRGQRGTELYSTLTLQVLDASCSLLQESRRAGHLRRLAGNTKLIRPRSSINQKDTKPDINAAISDSGNARSPALSPHFRRESRQILPDSNQTPQLELTPCRHLLCHPHRILSPMLVRPSISPAIRSAYSLSLAFAQNNLVQTRTVPGTSLEMASPLSG
ncbi:hypothetical protein K474DRAFT_475542 [Panus rudis PR-1116 ss-1]|nr:hypothetical protein K474DRAFT_475542 [Panus rudis PR-1116 ss-1]